jgi:hypothetical protein
MRYLRYRMKVTKIHVLVVTKDAALGDWIVIAQSHDDSVTCNP